MDARLLKNLDALLVTNPTNVRYLTGFVGAAPEEREAYCLLVQESIYLFTNALYLEQSRNLKSQIPNLKQKPITLVEISRENPFAEKLAEVLKGSRLGFEENDLTVAEYHKIMLEHKNVTLVPTQGRVEELRITKREDEIENIRAAAQLTDQCFDFILGKLKPGVTETEIAWKIESFIRKQGGALAFSPIVAFGKNSSMPHYQSSDVRLQSSDIILFDFGARVNGYCSDMTRVVFVGKPKEEWKRAYETVFEAQRTALEYLHLEGVKAHLPGGVRRSGATADRRARGVVKKAGFPPYPHSLGHGVGLDIHEAPRLTIKKDPSTSSGQALKPGMVVTIEPAIYVEASYGIRIEDLVVLKEDGIDMLSQASKALTVL